MEEIQASLIQSSLNPKNTTNCMIINKNEDEDENKEGEEERLLHRSNESTKNFHQFYFVKLSALKAKIHKDKELTNKLHKEKTILLDKIRSLKDKILKESEELRWNSVHSIRRDIELWKSILKIHYPESNNWDPELKPELESVSVDKKIQKLCYQFTHGSKSISNERKIFREFKELQRRKEILYKLEKTMEKNVQVIHLQHLIQEGLNEVRNRQEKENKVKRSKAEIAKEIKSLEEKLAKVNQKRAKVNRFILTSQKQLNDEIWSSNSYLNGKNKDEIAE